jgi:hypothetical protein
MPAHLPKRFAVLANILLAGILLFVHVKLFHYGYDDAYIHFRIARNLYETGQSYFNAGEAIKVSTSSAWTLTLTVLYALANLFGRVSDFPLIVAIYNALISLAGVNITLRLFALFFPEKRSKVLAVALACSCMATLLPASIGLMETPTAILLALIGITLLIQERPVGFLFLGLAAYYRIELGLLVILAFLFTIVQRSFRVKSILYAGIGIFPFLAYDLYFFRTILPASIRAKSIVYQIHWLATLFDILNCPAAILKIDPLQGIIRGISIYFSLILTIGLGIIVFAQVRRKKVSWLTLFIAWSLAIILGYTASHAFVFGWYIPLFIVPAAIAVTGLIQQAEYKGIILLKLSGAALLLLQILGLAQTASAALISPAIYANFSEGARVRQYLVIGAILYQDYPNATLLSSEIGGLGYAFPGYIYDAAGLASPQALAYHPLPYPEQRPSGYIGAIPPAYVEAVHPDIIVSLDVFAEDLLDSQAVASYQLIKMPYFVAEDAAIAPSRVLWNSLVLNVLIRDEFPVNFTNLNP